MAIVTYRRYRIEDDFERKYFYRVVLNEVPRNYTTFTASYPGGTGRTLHHDEYTFDPVNQTFELIDDPKRFAYRSGLNKFGVKIETSPYYCKIETLSIDPDTGFQITSGTEYQRVITLLDESISAEEGTYPANGAHTDGYWYRINTPFNFEMPTRTTYQRRELGTRFWRYEMGHNQNYLIDGVYVGWKEKDQLEFSYRLNPEDPFTVDITTSPESSYYGKDFPRAVNYVEFKIRFYSDEKGWSNPFYVPLDAFGALFPTVKTKINGVEKKIVQAHVKINGVLKPITKIYTKVGGQLKEL